MAPTKGSGYLILLQSAHSSFVHASFILELQPPLIGYHSKGDAMQKAHLFEALLMVNQGIDNAVQGLHRLKKKSGLLQEPYGEAIGRLELDRNQWNLRFFAAMETTSAE